MAYPYTFTDLSGSPGSYADVAAVQMLIQSFRLENDDVTNVRQVEQFLVYCTAEIDAVLLKAGYTIPAPANATILPILKQACAAGATAMLEGARNENGDENLARYTMSLQHSYDALMGLIERGDINGLLMGMTNAGWARDASRSKRYHSGNLEPLPNGDTKKPFFTMQMEW